MSYLNAKAQIKSLLDVEPAPDWLSLIINGVEYVPVQREEGENTVDIVTETFMHLHDAKKAIKNMEERLAKYDNWLRERP